MNGRRSKYTGEGTRRGLLIGWLLSMPFVSLAQRGWSVAVQGTPLVEQTSYPRRVFYPNSNGQIVEPIYLSGTRWATGVQGGLLAENGFAPGWSVSAGVGFRQVSTRQNRPGNDGTITINSRAIRVPVRLNFQSSQKRLSPVFTAGMLVDLPLMSRVTIRPNDQPARQTTLNAERGPVFYLMAGAGGRYRVNDRYALVMQPVLNYKIGSFGDGRSHNPAVEFGIQTQVVYSF